MEDKNQQIKNNKVNPEKTVWDDVLSPIDEERFKESLKEGEKLAEKVRKSFEPCFQIPDELLRMNLG